MCVACAGRADGSGRGEGKLDGFVAGQWRAGSRVGDLNGVWKACWCVGRHADGSVRVAWRQASPEVMDQLLRAVAGWRVTPSVLGQAEGVVAWRRATPCIGSD